MDAFNVFMWLLKKCNTQFDCNYLTLVFMALSSILIVQYMQFRIESSRTLWKIKKK